MEQRRIYRPLTLFIRKATLIKKTLLQRLLHGETKKGDSLVRWGMPVRTSPVMLKNVSVRVVIQIWTWSNLDATHTDTMT